MKMKKRIISLVLCILMVHSFSPAGLAAGSISRTDIMYRNTDVEEPKASSWLSVYEEKYVKQKEAFALTSDIIRRLILIHSTMVTIQSKGLK